MGLPRYEFDKDKFREMMNGKKWSRADLIAAVKKIGGYISPRSISGWKSGEIKPSVNNVTILETVFEVKIGYFFKK